MSLYKEIEKLKTDKRLTDWHLSRGKMTQAQLDKYLASLPDSASNVDSQLPVEESSSDVSDAAEESQYGALDNGSFNNGSSY